MKPELRALLAPHAEHFQRMASFVRECDPEELAELETACAAVTPTNCAWDIYQAAIFMGDEIRGLRNTERRAGALAQEAP